MWSTGPVANVHRVLLRDGKFVALFEDMVTCSTVVRNLNAYERLKEAPVKWVEAGDFL